MPATQLAGGLAVFDRLPEPDVRRRIEELAAAHAAQDARIEALRRDLERAQREITTLRASLAVCDQLRAEVQQLQRHADAGSDSLTERRLRALLTQPDFLLETFVTEEFMDIHDALNLELIESIHPDVFLWDPLQP